MRNLNRILLFCLNISLLVACSEDDNEALFTDPPAVRAEMRNNELLNLLTSASNGFKGTYFSKNDEFGGFTFYMRFNTDGTVDMTSDVDEDTPIQTSSFEVRLGTTNELVFTTRNHIQKLSDAFGVPGARTGFRGTSVFQFISNEDGALTFADIRNRNTAALVLSPSNLTDFEQESVPLVRTTLAARNNLSPSATLPVFQVLRIENANSTTDFNLNYDVNRLFANPISIKDNGEITELSFGVLFEENGLIVSPAIAFEGEFYENFVFNRETRQYTSTVNGTTARLFFGDRPAFINRSAVEELMELGPDGFFYSRNLGENPLTSPGFDALLAQVSQNLEAFGLGEANVTDVELIINYESDDCGTILFISIEFPDIGRNGIVANTFYCLGRGTLVNRTLFLNYQGPFPDNSPEAINANTYEEALMPLINFFNSEAGLVYSAEGTFRTDQIDGTILSAGTFTSLDSPAIRLYGGWFLN